jgi:hypothetical protein
VLKRGLIGFDMSNEIFIVPGVPKKGDVLEQPEFIQQARLLGKRLCRNLEKMKA